MKTRQIIIAMLAGVLLAGCQQQKPAGDEETNAPEKVLAQDETHFKQMAGETAAISYSGFRSGQHPDRGEGAQNPSYEEILEDLRILSKDAGFRLIRLYDCGENSEMTLRVIRENNLDIKVLLGIWLRAEISNHEGCPWLNEPIPQDVLDQNKTQNIAEIKKGIELARIYDDIIVAVNVGNEALVDWNDHMVPVDTVIAYVHKVRNAIEQEVTVADNYKWWAQHGKELSKAVDFVSIHIYPIWEGKNIDEGLSYSIENIMEVRDSLPEAKILITEAGWPTTASEFGDIASEKNQQRYIQELLNWAGEKKITTFIFEAFDEDWKGDPGNPLGAEKHWGIYNIDRTPKLIMQSKTNWK